MDNPTSKIDPSEYKLFKFVMDNSPDIVYIYDIIDQKNIYSNEGISIVLGYTVKEVQDFGNQLIPKLMHPDDFDNYIKTILPKYLKAKDNEWIEHDYRMSHKKGGWRWLHSKETIFERTKDNQPKQILGILSDITEEKNAKEKLQEAVVTSEESEKTFRKLFEDSSDAILLIDKTGVFVECNQAALDLLKMEREQFINQPPVNISPKYQPNGRESSEAALEMIDLAYKKGLHRFDWTCINSEGGEFIVEVSLMPIFVKGETMLHTSWRDITKRKKIEQELISTKEEVEENAKKYSSLFTSMQEGVYLHDIIYDENGKACNYRITDANPISEKYLNIKRKDAIGKIATDLYGTDEAPFLDIYAKVAETCIPVSFEQYFEPMDKHFFISVFSPKKGKFATAFLDITEKKKHEEELIKAKELAEESNRLKTEFLNNMSHEIRTPMNGIIGFSQFLDQKNLTPEKQSYFTRIIQNSAQQLLRVIDDILEISTLSTKHVKVDMCTFCLNDFLMELFSIFNLKARERKIPIYVKKGMPDKKSFVKTDKSKLSKVLMNLIDNAIKYTNDGFIEIGYICKKNYIQLYVKDTGIGIDTKNQKIIFERFAQEEKEISKNIGGLGLGLSIAKENAELINGTITLKSKKGEGSTFFLNLHNSKCYEEFNLDDKFQAVDTLKSFDYTILIAEDEEVNYLYVETLIENITEYNIKILHAKNGKEAIELLNAEKNIDLVLMDIKMPEMNGLEATKLIKKVNPSVPVIAQTAYSTEIEKRNAMIAGCSDFITKPINKELFIEKLHKYLNKRN